MPPKTAQQLIEDEVKEYRKELLRDVTKHSELKADDLDSDEIDAVIQEEKDEVEREVATYRVPFACGVWPLLGCRCPEHGGGTETACGLITDFGGSVAYEVMHPLGALFS